METAFKGMGYKVQTRELSHFHDDYGFKTGYDDEDEEESEEEEEGEYEDGDSEGDSEED